MITLNGEKQDGKEGISYEKLLQEEGYSLLEIAVELNEEILPKAQYAETLVKEGDTVEVVRFVGGG